MRTVGDRIEVLQENPSLKIEFLKVRQFGVAIKGGIEYAYHSSRLQLFRMMDETNHLQCDDVSVPGVDQIDCTNAFGLFRRSKTLKWKLENRPHLVRKYVFAYGVPATITYIWDGEIALQIQQHHGSQQGSVDGGHNFVFATLDFAEELISIAPEAHIVWIMDDLTVVGTEDERGKLYGPLFGFPEDSF